MPKLWRRSITWRTKPASSPIRSRRTFPSNRVNACATMSLAWNLSRSDTARMYEPDQIPSPVRTAHQYELETRRIRVAVKPAYLDDQSDPDDDRYVWSYTVTIENRSAEPVQLLSRYWNITDGAGRVQEVRAAGVVGAQPVIAPGE